MKGISKNKRGISLIVLVITIIVMIILASAIILSLRSSGIIDRANEAKTKSDIANAKDVVALAYAEWELDNAKLSETYSSFSEYANHKLGEAGFDTESMYVTEDGKLVTGPAAFFIANDVPIGTTVTGYDLSSNTKTTYTTDGKENTANDLDGEIGPTAQTVARGTDLAWTYMGIDENGDALIVANSTGTLSTMTLSGKGGYLNGPAALDTVCAALYSSDMGTARSMDYEDVTRLLEYEGPVGQYYNSEGTTKYLTERKTIGELVAEGEKALSSTATPDGSDINDCYVDYTDIPKTSTDIKAGDVAKGVVYQGTSYWLASPCVFARFDWDSSAWFCVRYVTSTKALGGSLIDSCKYSTYAIFAVRPVVKLASTVQMAYDGTTVTLS